MKKLRPRRTIELTMDEAKRVLDWRSPIHPKDEQKHWGEKDSALMDKLLAFVDD